MFTLFRRKPHGNDPKADAAPQPLRIEGIPEAPFTPEPDDAELAAEAVLELLARQAQNRRQAERNQALLNCRGAKEEGEAKPRKGRKAADSAPVCSPDGKKDAAYYHALASRIREAHAKAARQATRFIYNCELMLQNKHLPLYGDGSVQMLETELYKRIDVVEREGGELKRRWQHCLADVTVRLMNATDPPPTPPAKGGE